MYDLTKGTPHLMGMLTSKMIIIFFALDFKLNLIMHLCATYIVINLLESGNTIYTYNYYYRPSSTLG